MVFQNIVLREIQTVPLVLQLNLVREQICKIATQESIVATAYVKNVPQEVSALVGKNLSVLQVIIQEQVKKFVQYARLVNPVLIQQVLPFNVIQGLTQAQAQHNAQSVPLVVSALTQHPQHQFYARLELIKIRKDKAAVFHVKVCLVAMLQERVRNQHIVLKDNILMV